MTRLVNSKAKRKPSNRRTSWRVDKGCLRPADAFTVAMLRARNYKLGDVLSAELKKARNPGFNNLAHKLGEMLAENIDAFTGLDGHAVLKRLQLEGDIACDHMAILFPGIGPVEYRIPRSLSFDEMDEGEYRETVKRMCSHVSLTYWPKCSAEEIERMAELWVEAT